MKLYEAYQFLLLCIVTGVMIMEYLKTGTVDQVIIGAILGLMVGVKLPKDGSTGSD